MRRTWRTARRALGAPVAALMLLVGAAGPVLDAVDLLPEPRVVGCEDPGSSRMGHDHRLCLQVGANAALVSHLSPRTPVRLVRARRLRGASSSWHPSPAPGPHGARAPPSPR